MPWIGEIWAPDVSLTRGGLECEETCQNNPSAPFVAFEITHTKKCFRRFITADSAFTANSANTFGGAVLLVGTARNIFIRCVFSAGPWLENEEGVPVLCTTGERRSPRIHV